MGLPEKVKTVAETLAEFKARFPRERFIWVNSPLESSDRWPLHYALGARAFKIPTDNLTSTPKNNGWIYEIGGKFALMKPALLQLSRDAGVMMSRERHRTDDGTDARVREIEGSAAIMTLSGMTTVTATKRIDLDQLRKAHEFKLRNKPPAETNEMTDPEFEKWLKRALDEADGQRRLWLAENTESKMELRLIRKLLALPQSFTLAELQNKEFVTFCIFAAPQPRNAAESMLVLQHMLSCYGPAFPGAERTGLISGDAPRQIGAARPAIAEEITETEIDDEFPEPAAEESSLEGEATLRAAIPPQNCDTPLPSSSKEAEKKSTPTVENPLAELLEIKRIAFTKMSIEKLTEHIEAIMENSHYSLKDDPLSVIPLLQSGDKEKLIAKAVELVEWSIRETARIRDTHNAKRGGGRLG